MAIASGLGASFGFSQEATVGTFAAPTVWVDFLKESLIWKKASITSEAINGTLYESGDRRAVITHTVDGGVSLEFVDRGYGLLIANMLGSFPTPTEIGTTGVYTTTFTQGDLTGHSMSIQVGRPLNTGEIVPYAYNGVKVSDWTIGVTNTGFVTFDLTFDGWDESQSQTYTAPSYVPGNLLNFSQGTIYQGGTTTTTDGVASVSGASLLGNATSISIKGTNALEDNRYFIGGSGTKSEQLPNGFRKISGTVDLEFANTTDVLAAFYADSPVTLQLDFTGPIVATSPATPTQTSGMQLLLPQIRWDSAPPVVDGPTVLKYTAAFTALWDGVNSPIQVTTQSLDSTLGAA